MLVTKARLSNDSLPGVGRPIVTPPYDRSAGASCIVHIGVGNFFRSHQCMYLDDLRASDTTWRLRGVGVLPSDAGLLTALTEQDCLYTLLQKAPDRSVSYRILGSLSEVNRPGDSAQIMEWLTDPATKIVTLTITEGGYFRDPATGHFRTSAPEPAADAALDTPASVFGYIARALRARRDAGVPPFTVLSCDNLVGNGKAAHEAVVAFATALDADLGAWVDADVAFPCCMVDCITPAAKDADRAAASEAIGLDDRCTVTCEPFHQWVIEDNFPLGRPAWETVGAQMVDDVDVYEHMKLRLLNAAHQVLSHLGALAGLTTIDEAVGTPELGGLLRHFWETEAKPAMGEVPGMDLDEYTRTVDERLSNPGISDTIVRNFSQASDRIPTFLLPTVVDNLASGGPIAVGALVVAAWHRCLLGVDDHGRPIQPVDDHLDELLPLAAKGPLGLLEHPQLAGVAADERFREAVVAASESLARVGALASARAVFDKE